MLFIFAEFKTLLIGEILNFCFPHYGGNFLRNVLKNKNPAGAGFVLQEEMREKSYQ